MIRAAGATSARWAFAATWAVSAWLVLAAPSVVALERPSKEQLAEYLKDGSLATRIHEAYAIGNHRVRPDVAQNAAYRLRLQQWRSGLTSVQPGPPPAWKGMPTKGNVRIFALLIAFSDYGPSNGAPAVDAALFGDGAAGAFPYESLRNYYRRSSYNQLELQGATLGWYTTTYPRSSVPQTTAGREALIKEALDSLDAAGQDFAQYDNDGDGAIDYFLVIWAGPNNGWANFWWASQTRFGDASYRLDGKTLRDYSWQWESPYGAGTFSPSYAIHETGHALGLPDYYDYAPSLGPGGGLGGLDMMDADWGDHNAFSKFLLDWISPRILSSGSTAVSLRPSGSSGDAVLFTRGATADAFAEYFMIQNRTRAGNDSDLPGDGFLVWHVDARLNVNGTDYQYDNSYTVHKLLRLMEADGQEQVERGWYAGPEDYYVYPSTITHWTRPGTVRYDGTPSFMQVIDISAAGDQMTARIEEVFDSTPPAGRPTTPVDDGITTALDRVRFQWTPADAGDPDTGIRGYQLQVGTQPGAGNVLDEIVGNVLAWRVDHVEEGRTYYARVRALNGAGLPSAWSGTSDGITVSWPALPCEVLDNCLLTFETSGEALWGAQDRFAQYGPTAARSGAIGGGQTSSLRAVVTGPGSLTYQQALTSMMCCSELNVSIEGAGYSGGIGGGPTGDAPAWSEGMIWVPPGRHVVRWAFSTTAAAGDGAGWVDHVEWAPDTARGGIAGTVTDAATSLGIDGVAVYVYASSGALVGWSRTDRYGDYSVGDLPPGSYWAFTDNALGYVKELFDDVPCPDDYCSFEDGTPIAVTAGATAAGVDFALAKGGRIAGTVRAASSGAPVGEAYVSILDSTGRPVLSTWVDYGGGYVTDYLPAGRYHARTYNYSGYIDELFDDIPCPLGSCSVSSGSPIAVAPGATASGIDFVLTPGGRISGTVRDETTGDPIPGGCVEIFDSRPVQVACGYPDSAGHYTVGGLLPGTYYARTVSGSNYVDELFDGVPCSGRFCPVMTGTPIAVTAGSTASGVDFALAVGGRIGGHVTAERSGLPISGAYVGIYDSAGSPVAYDYTDASGLYLASAVPAGVYYARSSNNLGYIDELFDDIPCPLGSCSVETGTPITVTTGAITSGIDFALSTPPGASFYTVTPCRVLDTRLVDGPFGGAPLQAGQEISVDVAGQCGISASAQAVALNVTVTQPTAAGHLIAYPDGASRPLTSTINFRPGQTRANNAVATLGPLGRMRLYSGQPAGSGGTVHVILDVTGYFE